VADLRTSVRFVSVLAGVIVLAAGTGSSGAATGPSVPTVTSITTTPTTASLTWKASTGSGGMLYNVDLDHVYQVTVHGATSWTLSGLACSTVYTFEVQAIDPDGVRSTATALGVTGPCSPARVPGPLVPAHGVLFGAYVQPSASWSERGVRSREALIGRTYAIDEHVIGFGQAVPVSTLRWDVMHGRHPLLTVGGRMAFPGWPAIAAGSQDGYLHSLAVALRSVGGPVFFRPFQEFNGSWFANYSGDPSGFVAGWRRMWTIFHAAGATNVVWVWCPNAVDQPAGHAPHWTAYYPGDQYVDWVAVDGYDHLDLPRRSPLSLFMGVYNDYHTTKPIMIAETAALEPDTPRWMSSVRQTLKQLPDVAGIVWFDQNNASRGWDWRITTTPAALAAYRAWAADPYYAAR
jgi:Glycosyl hydrolase family 26